MNAELIAVGTELLLGDTINTDAAAVARLLSELGINVYWQTVVGDNRARLEQAVQLARTRADLIITTGGLGPTCDDLTKEVVAGAFGIPLELNEAEEARLRGLYRERHTYMTENHLQQVMLPRGCTVLQNDWGTAPACAFEADGCMVIMLPGPPLECEPLLRYRVRPLLAARGDGIIVSHNVKIFGIGEGTMGDLVLHKTAVDRLCLSMFCRSSIFYAVFFIHPTGEIIHLQQLLFQIIHLVGQDFLVQIHHLARRSLSHIMTLV